MSGRGERGSTPGGAGGSPGSGGNVVAAVVGAAAAPRSMAAPSNDTATCRLDRAHRPDLTQRNLAEPAVTGWRRWLGPTASGDPAGLESPTMNDAHDLLLAPDRPPGQPDVARTDGLGEAVSMLLPALDAFNRFEGPDLAVPRSAWLPLIDEPLPEQGVGAEAVLETLRDVVIPRGLRVGHPGFTGWVTTAPTTMATAAHLAQAVASPQRWWLQPGNHIDSMAVRWLIELLGFPASFVGTFTSGGSTANLVGMGAARQHAGERIGLDPAADGIEALPSPRVYASPETHHVVTRAMGVLGIGRDRHPGAGPGRRAAGGPAPAARLHRRGPRGGAHAGGRGGQRR